MRVRFIGFALYAVVALAGASPAAGLDLQHVLTGYSLSSWVERDGVPIGVVRAIVQDRDGYLWLGTSSGLLRFDGVRFVTAEALGYTDLPSATIRTLLISTRDNALWIGFDENAGVRVVRNGRVESLSAEAPQASVSSLAQDPSGAIWLATDTGLYSHDGRTWRKARLVSPGPEPTPLVVYADRRGTLWAGTSAGLFERAADGRFEHAGESDVAVRDIGEDARGQLWTTDPVGGFRRAGAAQVVFHGHEGIGLSIFHDRRSNIWLGTRGQGLWRIRPGEGGGLPDIETATVETGLVSNGVWDLLEDREGNIWVASQLGLNRLTPHTVTPLADLGLVHSVEAGLSGSVWVGTASGLIQLTGEAPDLRLSRTTVKGPAVRALYREGAALWAATDVGLAHLAGGRLVLQARSGSTPLRQIRSLTGDGRDGVWLVDMNEGLFHWSGTTLRPFGLPPGSSNDRVLFVYGDRHERLWVAFQSGRLGLIGTDQNLKVFTAQDGLPDGTHAAVNAVAEDKTGAVWIGGSGGLTRFWGGRFVTITRATGLPGLRVMGIATDDLGYLWLAIDSRIVRFHPDEFAKAAAEPGYRIHHAQFDQSQGVAGVALSVRNEGVARGTDGRIWFVTGRGLTVIDPHAVDLGLGSSAPLVRIEGAVADEKRFAAVEGASLPPQTTRLRIDYTALELTTPTKTRFRYRLNGFDPDWIDAGTRRQVFYMNLPPRSYRFMVQTADQDGRWIESSASWSFAIQPTFYQTAWFAFAVLATLTLAAYGAWQVRLRHVRREFALVLAERARLSREIHDTLLQNLAGVAIQCVGISNAIEPASPARAQLDTVRRHVEESLRETRQAVWNLRAPILETQDLGAALRETGERITAQTPVRFELIVSGKARRLTAHLENEVLRIAQEAMTNAVRHAKASRVEVALTFDRTGLRLRVSDDGCGFDIAYHTTDVGGQLGLISMKERAAELGGRLRVAVGAAGGTEVELVVPADFQPAEA